jgi:hypothetical protein
MLEIRLTTRDGAEVTEVVIPPFQKLPEIIAWAQRFFAFHCELKADGENCAAEYREVVCYLIPPLGK